MQWFADARFGVFIHWGIYAVDGIDESWAFYNGKISHADYMKQLRGFTAAHYDPAAWADLIARSGDARMMQAAHEEESHQAFSITTQPAPVMLAGTK